MPGEFLERLFGLGGFGNRAELPPILLVEHASTSSVAHLEPDDFSIGCAVIDYSAGDNHVVVEHIVFVSTPNSSPLESGERVSCSGAVRSVSAGRKGEPHTACSTSRTNPVFRPSRLPFCKPIDSFQSVTLAELSGAEASAGQGHRNVTVSEMAEVAGTSESSVFHHFPARKAFSYRR